MAVALAKNYCKFCLARHFLDLDRHVLRFPLHRLASSDLPHSDDYSETPEWPELLPVLLNKKDPAHIAHERKLWMDKLRLLPSVAEKLELISFKPPVPREPGLRYMDTRPLEIQMQCPVKFTINPITNVYNLLPYQKWITRTHLVNGLPEFYDRIDSGDKALAKIRGKFEDSIAMEMERYGDVGPFKCELLPGSFISSLVQIIIQTFANDYPHLTTAHVDQNARQESFWFVGGFPDKNEKGGHLQTKYGMCFQYKAVPYCQIRTPNPLQQVVDKEDPLSANSPIPEWKYHPVHVGLGFKRDDYSVTPGFWYGDPCKYGLLSVHNIVKDQMYLSRRFNDSVIDDIWKGQSVISGFSWLVAQAMSLGFEHFNDVTYPLVTQTVTTDGQYWSFSTYQLNTIQFSDYAQSDYRNICWTTGKLKLYDIIEDNRIKGINEEVLKIFLKFMLNVPQPCPVEAEPYLSSSDGDSVLQQQKDRVSKYYRAFL